MERIMKLKMIAAVSVALTLISALTGCNKDDGVPKVDIHGTIVVTGKSNGWTSYVPKVRMITLPNGKQMPLGEFLNTYCIGKETNETCLLGVKIQSIDSSNGPRDQLPPGL
jgi:hypothetical protein